MARIESLNVLLTTEGKDYLAEMYGNVIENVQKGTIADVLKNKDLSGSPVAGSMEAKRFENRNSNAYGTARGAGKGQAVKAEPVTVPVNVDRELLTEVENKDVALYGVENFIERQAALDEKSMKRELERAFFAEAVAKGGAVTIAEGATPEEEAEAMIQAVETVSNKFVDGVERDMIALVCSPAKFGKLRTYLDKVTNDGAREEVGQYHGVRVFSSVYLPEGTGYVAMADGAIAQPVRPWIKDPSLVDHSNAIEFGMFFSYGTTAVAKDLIFKA